MDNLNKNIADHQEEEIDLIELIKKIGSQWRLILKVCGIALIVAIVVAFSIPKTYTTKVILAPESNSANGSSMGQLASLAGINLNAQDMRDLSPDVYPSIINSTPFLMGLFDIPVKDSKMQINTSLYDYLGNKYQKKAWWSYIMNAPSKLIGLFSSKDGSKENAGTLPLLPLVITKQQSYIMSVLTNSINVDVDKKTGVITLSSTMQSAEISALIADTVTSYLQNYIISYRTKKARQDLNFSEMLFQDAKDKYYKAQQTYAAYTDENIGIISAQYRTNQDRMQNEMNLAFGIYNQMAQQLQLAKVKVQDMTPVYTIVQPAVVPLPLQASPKKLLIVIAFVFLAFVGVCGWIAFVKDFLFEIFEAK